MLYIFAGFPGKAGKHKPGSEFLHGGSLRFAFCACPECCDQRGEETPETPLLLEHDPRIQVRREGAFIGDGFGSEFLCDVSGKISNLCLLSGIGPGWYPENWTFGNGLTIP